MATTKIEWAEKTWNPITGCTKISPGCANCYAERMATRLAGRCGYPKDEPFKVTLRTNKLAEPLNWRKPARIFVGSMTDIFHPDVPFQFLNSMFGFMHSAKQHTYIVLTKRPDRMAEFFQQFQEWTGFDAWPREYHHVWLGVTAENQEQADRRIPILLQIPAAVRFVSVEPMLGPVDVTKWLGGCHATEEHGRVGVSGRYDGRTGNRPAGAYLEDICTPRGSLEGKYQDNTLRTPAGRERQREIFAGTCDGESCTGKRLSSSASLETFLRTNSKEPYNQPQERRQEGQLPGELGTRDIFRADQSRDARSRVSSAPELFGAISWVICGGESGPGSRPMHPDWLRGLRDQCQAAGIPFLFKQWGEWAPYRPSTRGYCSCDGPTLPEDFSVRRRKLVWGWEFDNHEEFPKWMAAVKVGKKAAGRLLDGELWDQYPVPRQ